MLILETFFLGACFFCAMEVTDLLWISMTVNVCAALFFLLRALIGRLAGRCRDSIEDKSVWRSVVDKHEDEPWRFPRFCLDVIQSAVMTTTGFTILCVDDVIHDPFRGTFSNLTETGFSIAIGCYIYRIFQDSVLHSKVKHFKVDLVHHLVTIAVYGVFLTYRENALFGAIGLICTGSVPSVEMTRLLKVISEASGKPTALMGYYRWNLLIGAGVTFVVRLLIPLILGTFAVVTSSPLTMSVPVVAFFFTSLMFFGSINIWLCAMSVLAIHRRKRRHLKDVYVSALDGQSRKTFPTTDSQQATILAKKNPIKSRLTTPCANVNITPSDQTSSKMPNNHSLPNNYAKVPVNEALVLPFRDSIRYHRGRSSEESSQSGSNRSSRELMVVQVGDEDGVERSRAVRFLVPRTRSSQDSLASITSATPASPNNRVSPQPTTRPTDRATNGRLRVPMMSDADRTSITSTSAIPLSNIVTPSVSPTRSRTLPSSTSVGSPTLTRSNSVPNPVLPLGAELSQKERTRILSSMRRGNFQSSGQTNLSLENETTFTLSSSPSSSRQNIERVNDGEHRRNSMPSIQQRSQGLNSENNLNRPNLIVPGHDI